MNTFKYNGKLNVVGKKIKYYREKDNLSLSQLSNQLMLLGIDVPKSSLHRIETGYRALKDYELAGLSKVFKITPNDLLEDFLDEI